MFTTNRLKTGNLFLAEKTGSLKAAREDAKKMRGRPPGTGGPVGLTRRNVMAAQKKFQEYEERALEVMVEILNDTDADHAVRLKAANDIWNRSRGTPVSVSVQHQIQEREQGSPVNTKALSSAGTQELLALAQALSRYVEDKENTIDITPEMPDDYPDK
jgi:hypothetical protein